MPGGAFHLLDLETQRLHADERLHKKSILFTMANGKKEGETMSKFKFDLSSKGVIDLMQSEAAAAICMDAAEKVAATAMAMSGKKYEVKPGDPYIGTTRAKALVHPVDYKAYIDNLEHNTLIKAIGSTKVGK